MAIWQTPISLEVLKKRGENSMVAHLGIEFTEIADDFLSASMPVDHRTHQSIGIMHGGASCVLAETVGSMAANFCVDLNKQYCVGLDINTNHIRSIKSGYVTGTAKPFHLGRTTQVWGININDEQGRLISVTRLTMAVLNREFR